MSKKTLTIATRKSPLALWQANHAKEKLQPLLPDTEIKLLCLKTTGDKFLQDKLLKIGGKGLFVKELEQAMLDKKADIAVHSMKDVPAEFPDGLMLGAICTRENPYDAFVSDKYKSIEELPAHAIVGTSSLRRQSQVLAHKNDLIVKTIRGNIHTRLRKMREESFDAIILAAAGLIRMDFFAQIKEILPEELMLPACGQGALGIECREDSPYLEVIQRLNDPKTHSCVSIEREVNKLLGGNCHLPLAVFCTTNAKNEYFLRAKVAKEDGSIVIKTKLKADEKTKVALAQTCVNDLIAKGAKTILDELKEN